jgi:hypothetical protein
MKGHKYQSAGITFFTVAVLFSCLIATGSTDARPLFFVARPIVAMELSYENEDERRNNPFRDQKEVTDTFKEILDIRSVGWLYHPALAKFSFGFKPEWKQQSTDSGGDAVDRDDDSNFYGYFVDARLLPYKPYTLDLYSRHDRSEFDSTLNPDSVTESDINRATLFLKSQSLPTSLTYEHREVDFQGFRDSYDEFDTVRLESKHLTNRSQTFLRAENVSQDREINNSGINVDRHLVSLNNAFRLKENARLSTTFLTFDTKTDGSKSDQTTFTEALYIDHTSNFETNYELTYETRDEESFSSDILFLSAGLEHQLYENLTTSLDVDTRHEDTSNGEIDVYETALDFHYNRRIPGGRVRLRNGYGYRVEDNSLRSDTALRSNEPHRLIGTTVSFLDAINVDEDSIVVTDNTETIVYIENLDYVVTVQGDSVGIARDPFGGIADGQQVLVDYTFTPQAPFKTGRRAIRFGAALELWRKLELYYNFQRVKEDLLSGTRPVDLTNDTINIVGFEYQWRWSTTSAEYEDRDTVRTPLSRWRVDQTLYLKQWRKISFSASAGYAETQFDDSGDEQKDRHFGANLHWLIGPRRFFESRAFSEKVTGNVLDTNRDGIVSRFEWGYGAWTGTIKHEFLKEHDGISEEDRDRHRILLILRRLFR